MLSRVLVCFLDDWKPFYSVGMLSTELEYLCTRLKCFLEGWNACDSVGIPLFIVGLLSRALECFRHTWHTFVPG
jgi:hypothetical protein